MIVRRIFYYWQFIAIGVLPLWLLAGSAIFGAGGWEVLGVTIGAIALGVALLVVALLVYARAEVRETRTVSWPDVGVFGLWHALVIAGVFYAADAPGVWLAAVLAGIVAFWFALWELFDAARRRVRQVIDYIDSTDGPLVVTEATLIDPAHPGRTSPVDPGRTSPVDPEVIVIPEKPTNP